MTFAPSIPWSLSMPFSIKKRIGIFGGAFDPPHKGHEKALLTFLRGADLDLVYVIPSGIPPHKVKSGKSADSDRLEMAKLAFSPISEKIVVSDMEIASPETSYTYLTVEKISASHPEDEIFLFIGTDQLLSFESWRRVEYLFSRCTLCVMDRFDDGSVIRNQISHLEKKYRARFLLLEEKAFIISSTEIREELSEKGFSFGLSPKVNDYIALHGLYLANGILPRNDLILRLCREIGASRLSHTLSVERECVFLSELLGLENTKEMSLAALFHDLTKEKSTSEQIRILNEFGVKPSSEDIASPAVLHGMTAALLAEQEGLLSEKGVSAVRFHTTGKENMTVEEMVLYLADYMEETRKHPACIALRKEFYENLPSGFEGRLLHLKKAVYSAMKNTLLYIKEKNMPIHPLTQRALLDLEQKGIQ